MKSPKRSFFSVSRSEKVVLVCVVVIVAWIIIPLTRLNPAHKYAETEYAHFHDRLQLGMTLAEVVKTFDDLQPKYIEFHVDDDDVWITTPSQISARNWRMVLEFTQDKLTRVHSQIIDFDAFPEGAPPDKEVEP